jgi:NADPH-dependent 2,4-dienoyl-CoA reductase/sulfur reductase-like enzyme
MNAEQVIVVGAGIAGCSAALEAVKHGFRVTLVDEHPQTLTMMSLDTPYFYGARLSPVLSDTSAIADRVLGANDPMLNCLEAGVDVLTGTCVWGSYAPAPNSTSTDKPQLGLADADRSWMVNYDHLILAPGARDLVLSFPGWQLPGVLGAAAALILLGRYQALSGNRMVILGSGNTGLRVAERALKSGVDVAAIVDVAPRVRGDQSLAAELKSAGVQFLTSHVPQEALGRDGVQGLRLRKLDDTFRPLGDDAVEIHCDTVCMAFGLVPNVELAAITGCALEFNAARGGWVPKLDSQMRTSILSLYVVGDGAGITEQMLLDPELAAEQGRRAARVIAGQDAQVSPAAISGERNEVAGRTAAQDWSQALVAVGGLDVVVCQCEEVTRRELLEVRPPRYLGSKPAASPLKLSATGRATQDLFKRLTRAGMGHCQGKRCRDQTALLLANAAGIDVSNIAPGSYRPPVRPLPLSVLAVRDETEELRQNWSYWFHALNEGEVGR